MTPPKTAVIRIASSKKDIPFIFRHKIAGLSVFKRLIFTLQRAGIENFIILQQDESTFGKHWVETDIQNDLRFKSNFQWNNLREETFENDLDTIKLLPELDKILLVESNVITTTGLIKDFINSAHLLEIGAIASLVNEVGHSDGIHLLLPSNIERYLRSGSFEKEVTPITLSGPWFYRQRVKDSPSAKLAEKNLLNEHKLHYRQAMDIWVNSLFAAKISSFLAKTSITPNQITLFGMVVGMGSGMLFAQGNYWSGLMGGLLFVATAVLDCCDGNIARLKFIESDFGEKLDTACDNIINIFVFTGIMFGIAHSQGLIQATIPFFLLALGGSWIFYLIYFPRGGKGAFFKNAPIYDAIQVLASRNFIYIVLVFAIVDKLDWFLWLAGIGSNIFALSIYMAKRKILVSTIEEVER